MAVLDHKPGQFRQMVTAPQVTLAIQVDATIEVVTLPSVELAFVVYLVRFADAIEAIAKKAIERKTGARGLRSIFENVMSDIMFDIPSNPDIKEITITKDMVEKKQCQKTEKEKLPKAI